jgi:1-acyl-sn-glycerol-3-phosphate acyltransferase
MPVSADRRGMQAGGVVRGGNPVRVLLFVYQCVAFYFFWIVFGVLSFLWSMVAAVLYWVLPRRLANPFGRVMIMSGFRMFIGLLEISGLVTCDLKALDSLKDDTLVIAPNHPGRLDVMLMISRLPRAVCIIKAPLWRNLFLGGAARLAGYIRNDTPMNMIKTAAQEVRNGQSLLVFPEGTRSTGRSVGHFRGGFALIAKFAGVPVQTVFIENSSGYLGKGWPLFKMPVFPLVFRVRLGRRFQVPDKVEAFVDELENYYREELGQEPAGRA